VPQVIVVHPQRVPVKDLKEFLAFVRKNPGKLNYGSAGNGTSHHLAGELFKLQTKTFITHIRTAAPAGAAGPDRRPGRHDVRRHGSSASHIRGGRIKALAVASERRAPGFADVPTSLEAGGPDYKVSTGMASGHQRHAKRRCRAFAGRDEEGFYRRRQSRRLEQHGAEVPNLYGDDFGKFVGSEIKRWAEVVRASGAKLD